MKQNWTRLVSMMRNLGFNAGYLDARFKDLFLRHHRNACEIIVNHAGEPLAAVYFSPLGKHQEEFKKILRQVRERSQYFYEMEND